MLKTIFLGLSVSAVGLSLLLPCYAAAPVKIATVAPVGDLAGQIEASIKLLDEYLATNETYTQSKKKVRIEATVVAVLSQAVVESDDKASVAWNAAAADLRDAARSIGDSKTYDAAKKGLEAVKAAHGGTAAGAKPEHEWNKLAGLGAVMDAINSRSGKIRNGSRKKADTVTDAELADGSGAASVLAVLALAVHDDTHEVKSKKKEDIDQWQKFAKEFQTQLTATSAAFKKKDMAGAADGWKKGNAACNECHAKFREKE